MNGIRGIGGMRLLPIVALLAIAISACKSVQYVPVESVRTDSVVVVQNDTVYISKGVTDKTESNVKDSIRESVKEHVTVVVNQAGDTVYSERVIEVVKDRYLQQENNRLLSIIDSLRSIRNESFSSTHVDSVQVPYPVPATLTRWQQFKLDLGGIAFGIAIVAIIIGLIWLIRKLKGKLP